MSLKIVHSVDMDDRFKQRADAFILDYASNGEFIHTFQYLSYHPDDRFVDDSIVVIDDSTGMIKSVVMAGSHKHKLRTVVSHPGTTFAGPIFQAKQGVDEIEDILQLILHYYESNYEAVTFKLQPTIYAPQPIEDVAYLLTKNEYRFGYSALANVIGLCGITDEDDILALYQSRRRGQVRKLMKEKRYAVETDESIDETIWNNMNGNLENRYDTSTTHSFHEITVLKEMFPDRIVPYAAMRTDGEYGAFALVFKFKQVFHTQYLDQNYALSAENSNVLLAHQLIQMAADEGFAYFSFGASTENGGEDVNQGLYDFKKKFGGGRMLLPVFEKDTG